MPPVRKQLIDKGAGRRKSLLCPVGREMCFSW